MEFILIHLNSYYIFIKTSHKNHAMIKQCQDSVISVRPRIPNSEEHILIQMPYFQNSRVQQDGIYWEWIWQLPQGSLKHLPHQPGILDLVTLPDVPPLSRSLRLMNLSPKEHMSVHIEEEW